MGGQRNQMFRFTLITLFYHYYLTADLTNGLKIEEFNVPEVVEKGLDYELGCDYYLNTSETLYALRWYKNDEEFFRYMPKETPTRRVFNVRGIKINLTLSTSSHVRLVNVGLLTSGHYRCEVSVEAPSFETDVQESSLIVIEPPIGHPFITSSRGVVGTTVNEPIIANCSGPEGLSAPQLTWTLGSIPIPTDDTLVTNWIQDGITADKMKRMISMLHLPAIWIRNNFVDQFGKSRRSSDVVPLRCTSRVRGLFEQSDTVNIRLLPNSVSTTAHPIVPRDGSKLFKSSFTPRPFPIDKNGTQHGALRNSAISIFKDFNIGWRTDLSLTISMLWTVSHHFKL